MEPEEERYDILDTINEVARGKRTSDADAIIPRSTSTSGLHVTRLNVVPPSILRTTTRCTDTLPKSPDPPCSGYIRDRPRINVTRLNVTPPSILGEDSITMSDAFADLELVGTVLTSDDGGMSSYESTNYSGLTPSGGGCGPNIFEQSRGILNRGGAAIMNTMNGKRSVDPDASAIVSDDDADDDDDVAIHRPWKGRWEDDRRSNANSNNAKDDRSSTTKSRAISPRWGSDGSNYDPDSDWDVDDAEVEYDAHDVDAFEARPRRFR
jgi:hypothetical protein